MPVWKKDGEPQLYLEGLFESSELSNNDKPKDVYEKYAIFRDYSIDVFRKNFNLVKKNLINGKSNAVTPDKPSKKIQQSTSKGM